MRGPLASTSTRTFVVLPTVALVEAAVRRRRPDPRWVPLLAWGYLQYHLCGRYRTRRGGGGPGMSRPPERLVTTGPYAVTRNPMYLGHLVFAAGLVLTTGTLTSAVALGALPGWFDRRVQRDEHRLRELFGASYDDYAARVPRWIGKDAR